ncbi:MAG: GPR endopeptidase [Lachnospiraceae bacterium]|nr:GPR endopeptidase [Lachnospiraceae bacterium]
MGTEAFNVRTDLALEVREDMEQKGQQLDGVTVTEENRDGFLITTVSIDTEEAAGKMGKVKGNYLTIEVGEPTWFEVEEELAAVISEYIRKLLPPELRKSVLVVGLGNRQVTPDALGPWIVDRLCVNRHYSEDGENQISAIAPGVMAQTGIETAVVVKGVVEETKPTAIIALDALAARNVKRLNATIQLSDAGISPGSGVGNHRNAIDKESMGVPVIALGIPTVVDATTIASDTMGRLMDALDIEYKFLSQEERRALVYELLDENLKTMFLTPKNVDESVVNMSDTLAKAICMGIIE